MIKCIPAVPLTLERFQVIELPLLNPELFLRVGVKPPKGVLLYGPPGTGKTLLAKAVASTLSVNFLKVVSSAIVDKYIGESARLIREMFGKESKKKQCNEISDMQIAVGYAKEHEPCIIFMDEIDAIGGRRFSEGTSADREIQRTLMEVYCEGWLTNNWIIQGSRRSILALKSNGWFRRPWTNKTHYGYKSSRHLRSCFAATGSS